MYFELNADFQFNSLSMFVSIADIARSTGLTSAHAQRAGWYVCKGAVGLLAMQRFVAPVVYHLVRSECATKKMENMYNQAVDAATIRFNPGMRRAIQDNMTVGPHGAMRSSHPHPVAASARNAATFAMHGAASAMGFMPYVISPSDREKGVDSQRSFYSAADLSQRFTNDPVTKDHIIVMTDVDYFVDMPKLISLGRPILSYTFSPTTVAGEVNEGFFTIKDNEVTFRVAGGKTVVHPIWDYNQDAVMTTRRPTGLVEIAFDALHMAILGVPMRAHVSTVDSWVVGPHRRIVAITPFATTLTVFARKLGGTWLEKMRYKHGEFNVLKTYGGEVPQISIGREGDVAAVNMSLSDFDCTRIAHLHAGKNKHLSDTTRRSKVGATAPVLHSYLVQENGGQDEAEVYVGQPAEHFTVLMSDATDAEIADERKEYAVMFAPPAIGAQAVFPHECEENARASILGRITKPQRNRATWTSQHNEWAIEFVNKVLTYNGNVRGTGEPMDVAEVHDVQSRPTQRQRSEQRQMSDSENMLIKAFQKREAYGSPNDPRNISSMPTMHTLQLSAYTLQMKQVLKALPFYVPGMTPANIASAIMDMAAEHSELTQTDFSRFDGHINKELRTHVEFAVYLGWVSSTHREHLRGLLTAELNPKSIHGRLRYEAGCSRLSGSPLTSDGNTLINAYVQYATMRRFGLDKDESFRCIGLICGDDAVVPTMGIREAGRALVARGLGLKLKVEKESKSGDTVGFLSRVFVDPWTSPASVQDPKRTLLKLHTTVDTVSTIEQAGTAKTVGYLVTDAKTPIVGDWCRCYLRNVSKVDIDGIDRDVPYYARPEFKPEPWPQEEGHAGIVAEHLGVETSRVVSYSAALAAYNGPIEGMPMMWIPSEAPKAAALQGSELLQAGPSNDSTATQNGYQEHSRVHQSPTGRASVVGFEPNSSSPATNLPDGASTATQGAVAYNDHGATTGAHAQQGQQYVDAADAGRGHTTRGRPGAVRGGQRGGMRGVYRPSGARGGFGAGRGGGRGRGGRGNGNIRRGH